jgi:hypothetical protein
MIIVVTQESRKPGNEVADCSTDILYRSVYKVAYPDRRTRLPPNQNSFEISLNTLSKKWEDGFM